MLARGAPRRADLISHLSGAKTPNLSDLTGAHSRPLHCAAVVEDVDPRHLRVARGVKVESIAHTQRAREHAEVRDLVVTRATLDLEHGSCWRTVRIARGRRQ